MISFQMNHVFQDLQLRLSESTMKDYTNQEVCVYKKHVKSPPDQLSTCQEATNKTPLG